MKKLLQTLAFVLGLCLSTTAQNISYSNTTYFTSCNSGTNTVTPDSSSTPGVTPGDTTLPCITRGTYVSDTIYITNFTSFQGFTVNYLKVDSIYLPTGLCWNTNKANNQFGTGESGVILAYGITDAPEGQYKLRIIVDANAGPAGLINLTDQDAEKLIELRFRVKVIDTPGCSCPPMNHADTTDSYIAYSCVIGGIEETADHGADFSVSPNPFSQSAIVSFSSESEGACIIRLTDLRGAELTSERVNMMPGQNNVLVDRKGLATGLYLLSITNDHGTMAKKVSIE